MLFALVFGAVRASFTLKLVSNLAKRSTLDTTVLIGNVSTLLSNWTYTFIQLRLRSPPFQAIGVRNRRKLVYSAYRLPSYRPTLIDPTPLFSVFTMLTTFPLSVHCCSASQTTCVFCTHAFVMRTVHSRPDAMQTWPKMWIFFLGTV